MKINNFKETPSSRVVKSKCDVSYDATFELWIKIKWSENILKNSWNRFFEDFRVKLWCRKRDKLLWREGKLWFFLFTSHNSKWRREWPIFWRLIFNVITHHTFAKPKILLPKCPAWKTNTLFMQKSYLPYFPTSIF